MSTTPTAVRVRILDNDYQIACPPEERDALISAASYLDDKMRAIRAGGAIIGAERLAVMAGLNIAHELLKQNRSAGSDDKELQRLADKVTRALGSQSQLEL